MDEKARDQITDLMLKAYEKGQINMIDSIADTLDCLAFMGKVDIKTIGDCVRDIKNIKEKL